MPKPNYPTLAHVLQGTNQALVREVVEGVAFEAPFFNMLPSQIIGGISFKQKVRTSVPLISAMPYNTGVPLIAQNYEMRSAECYLYRSKFVIDKALLETDKQAAANLEADTLRGGMRGIMATLEFSAFYGKAFSPYGMTGLVDTIGDYMTFSADPECKKSSTDDASVERKHEGASVWAVCLKPEMIRVIWGNSKAISFGNRREIDVPRQTIDGKDGLLPAVTRDVMFHVGLDQPDDYATARIVNESDAHPLTDRMLADLVNTFPSGYTPDVIVMPRSTRRRLQEQRAQQFGYQKKTSGSTPYAQIPTDYDGIPIITSDALLEDETEENIASLAKLTELRAKKNMYNLIN